MGELARALRAMLVGTVAVAGVTTAAAATAAPAAAVSQVSVVDASPSKLTPDVDDGIVETIAKVGNRVYLGGTFTTVRDPGSSTPLARTNILAFDATTGAVDQSFVPQINGEVGQIIAGPANSVYVVGSFTQVNGVKTRIVRLDGATGAISAGWKASVNNITATAALGDGVLYVGGSFSKSGGNSHAEMAALDPLTGKDLSWFKVDFAGRHGTGRAKAELSPKKIVVSPNGSQMVVIGNFTSVTDANGTTDRDQVALIDLGPGTASINRSWRSVQFTGQCSTNAFDSWVRDVDIDPTGTYFVVAATGGQWTNNVDGTKALCDSASRWELNATGTSVLPTWVALTGRDTLLSVAVSGAAVYVGGHERWMNNPLGSDNAKEGAVPRPGLAALDPSTGVPLSWNPGRNPRGVGTFAILVTDTGLYTGSDTDYIGNYRYHRGRVAFFPIATGSAIPSDTTGTIPGKILAAGGLDASARYDVLYRVNAAGPAVVSTDGGPSWVADNSEPSSYRNSGSTVATYSGTASLDSTIPAGTPTTLFNTERYDPGVKNDGGEMKWAFPVASGTTVNVRLYFANRASSTTGVGSRKFDVAVEGSGVLSSFDIIAATGNNRGTMRQFSAVSDGTINIDFTHGTNNPLVNAIEIVQTSPTPAGPPDPHALRASTVASSSSFGSLATTDTATMDWATTRGAFLVGSTLFYGKTDGTFNKRSYDGGSFGPEVGVDPYNDALWSPVDSGSGATQTYRGVVPNLYGQFVNVSSMFYANHRIYYTLTGASTMYSRYFVPESGIMAAQVTVVDGRSWTDVAGAFVVGDSLYYASRSNGALYRTGWDGAKATGTAVQVDKNNNWAARSLFLVSAPDNSVPTARVSVNCPETTLACTFDATASTDSDGSIVKYDWDFGDGQSAPDGGPTVSHDYVSGGVRQVTLSVTDNAGAVGTTTQAANPTTTPAVVSFQGSTQGQAANASSIDATIPPEAHTGDGLVLIQSVNSGSVTSTDPAGWTLVRTVANGSALVTKVYSRVAQDGDAGSTVTIAFSARAKITAAVLAYQGTDLVNPVGASAVSVDTATSAHVTPTVTPTAPGSMALSLWQDKANISASAWSTPAEVTSRSTVVGGSGGAITQVVADSGAAIPTGVAYGGLTATSNATSVKGATATFVLTANPVRLNMRPTASMEATCPEETLSCSFDGSASADSDGSIARYDWDFGDGSTAADAGPTVNHVYGSSGSQHVVLTVTDNEGLRSTVSKDVSPTAMPATIAFRGSSELQANNASSITVAIPASVQLGDGLLLVQSVNNGSATSTDPEGWTLVQQIKNGSAMVTKAYWRVATQDDAGRDVTIPFSLSGKISAAVTAYSGTDQVAPLAASMAQATTTTHITPSVNVERNGSWVVSLWQDKASLSASTWSTPPEVTTRSTLVGGGGGAITQVLGDSGAFVPKGTYSGLTANTDTASSKGIAAVFVLQAG
ncbi:hypothetical protein BA895_08335 [Humibacillus sp. DSM 29435]|uniref:PKD domain-containing protein n=1 Tax=Humibacillus sp. DSM 29435 TaxID=1869167 RepID=UPI000871D557|nr:PKD domain-containing protein [Humibacillus sp. DSM 29435]OFE15118.1 hypothetical protein BA895_08335 [Humibacillus sp. DSM 29435]